MSERNGIPRPRRGAERSFLQTIELLFAILGVLATFFVCLLIFLLFTKPDDVRGVVAGLVSLPTPEPEIIALPANISEPLPTYTYPPTYTPLVVEVTSTLLPTAATSMPTSAPTSTSDPNLPTGDWYARASNADDVNVILVNTHIVGASINDSPTRDTDWLGINPYLRGSAPNYVTFVNINGPRRGVWLFRLQNNDSVVWGHEGETNVENSIGYLQTIQIFPDNSVKEVNLQDDSKEKLAGPWYARVIANDIGLLLINGIPAAASYSGKDFGWSDVSQLLYAGVDNSIVAVVWNISGNFDWDFALRKGETIVWGANNSGSGQTGEILYSSAIIDKDGNVIH